MSMRTVYIAHPISGDVKGNLDKVRTIVKTISKTNPGVIAVAPYYLTCLTLDDSVAEEREKGMAWNTRVLKSGAIDELWAFGHRSNGVALEIELCKELDIPVREHFDERAPVK